MACRILQSPAFVFERPVASAPHLPRPVPRAVAHATPNPDSLKFTAEPSVGDAGRASFIPGGLESFNSASEAAGDPLGKALFEISGVAGVLVLPAFVTVTKRRDADWGSIAGAVEIVLNEHLSRTPSPHRA
jgi:hypothetical protein